MNGRKNVRPSAIIINVPYSRVAGRLKYVLAYVFREGLGMEGGWRRQRLLF
jgi:hypothetical protein